MQVTDRRATELSTAMPVHWPRDRHESVAGLWTLPKRNPARAADCAANCLRDRLEKGCRLLIGARLSCQRRCPFIGRVTGTNLWLAYGHYRNGILLAPLTAQRIASEIASKK